MGTQGSGRRRLPNRERLTAEDDALNQIAREAEARLAAKRAARAEAREIRMRELERQQKEIYQVQKKYYGLDTKWGDIEQWMEDSERYSRRSRRNTSASDEDERMSVGSRGSLRAQSELECGGPHAWTNGCDGLWSGSQAQSRRSGRASEYSSHLNSSSRASSRASSARASPVVEERPEKDFTEKGSRNMPGLSAATLASLGGTSSRRGSGDTSISMDTEASIREIKELNELKDQIQDVEGKYMQGLREMKDSLAEVEEKYKKAMVSNAQLDNEKTNFMYQVDTLKDTLLELEEQLAETQRLCEEKSQELEREKHAHSVLKFQFSEVKEALRQREEMLEEIRQLQQKQASYIREISDLQETIEWKDKKIGALERQKEFFDSIRSERDDLREEIVKLKEELKKHGIILNSEITTNGETSDTLNNVGYQGPTKVTKEELNALQSAGDGTLGRANEMEVKKEIVETVGKREPWQNAEHNQHKENTGEECVDTEGLHPGVGTEGQESSEHSASAPAPLASAGWEGQVQGQILGNTSVLENPEQVGLNQVADMPDGRTRASTEQSGCVQEVEGDLPGPVSTQYSENAPETQTQREDSIASQEREQEGLKTDMEKSRQESVPEKMPETEKISSATSGGPGGNLMENEVVAKGREVRVQVDTVASDPPAHGSDTLTPDGKGMADDSELGTGHSLACRLSNQGGAGLKETPVQSAEAARESAAEEDGDTEPVDEKPVQTDAQSLPRAPTDTEHEADKEKNHQQVEALDSSQKKTKNKKKKNKKKKTPAPAETLQDVKSKLTCQNTDAGEAEEKGQVQFADKNQVTKALNATTKNPKQEIDVGSREYVDGPENPEIARDGTVNHKGNDVSRRGGEETADGDMLTFDDDTVQSAGTGAGDKLDEQATEGHASGVAQSSPAEPENEVGNNGSLLENKAPSQGGYDAALPGQTAGKGSHSISLGKDGLSASGGELGDLSSEDRGRPRTGSEKSNSKEDCTMS
ncbi:leucine-rich repeat flightless-interacting protein 1 isoform 4-T4 [Thomomys bottae]